MVRTHYPPYLKTVLKAGAITHLLFLSACMTMAWVRQRETLKNSRPRRRFHKAGRFDSMLQVRDERQREVIRPILDWQPNDMYGAMPSKAYKSFH